MAYVRVGLKQPEQQVNSVTGVPPQSTKRYKRVRAPSRTHVVNAEVLRPGKFSWKKPVRDALGILQTLEDFHGPLFPSHLNGCEAVTFAVRTTDDPVASLPKAIHLYVVFLCKADQKWGVVLHHAENIVAIDLQKVCFVDIRNPLHLPQGVYAASSFGRHVFHMLTPFQGCLISNAQDF